MMLERIQQSMQGPIMKVVLFIIIIFFIFAGYFSANLLSPEAGEVAEVDGVAITSVEIDNVIARQRRQNENFDQQYPTEASKVLLRSQVREQLINDRVFVSNINKAGLTASNEQVQEQIRNMPEFQLAGVYSADQAKTVLAQNNISNARLKSMAKDQITRDQFSKGISESSFTLDTEIEAFYRVQEQTRDARVLKVAKSGFTETSENTAEEIQAYYDLNKSNFQQAEKVNLHYIILSKANIAQNMLKDITPEQVSAYYNSAENKPEFVAPDQITIAHILISNDKDDAQAKASELLTQIKSGSDFAELAKAHSDDTGSGEQGGILGVTDALKGNTGWVPEFETAALGLTDSGQVSELVESQFGFHILKLIERQVGEAQAIEVVSDEIKKRIADAAAETEFFTKQALLNDAIFSTENITDLATTAELELKQSGLFESAAAFGDLANPALIEQAFSPANIKSKDISDEIKLGDQSVAYIAVKDHQAAGFKSLENVKAQIATALTSQKAQEKTKLFAESIKTALDEGKSVTELLAEKSLVWIDNKAFGVRDAALEPELLRTLFEQKSPSNKPIVALKEIAGGDFAVVELRQVNYPELSLLDDAKKQQYKFQLDYLNSQGDFRLLLDELKEISEIK